MKLKLNADHEINLSKARTELYARVIDMANNFNLSLIEVLQIITAIQQLLLNSADKFEESE